MDDSDEFFEWVGKAGLRTQKQSPFFGRYRIRGDQVLPNYRPSCDIYLKLKPGAKNDVKEFLTTLDPREYPVTYLFRIFESDQLKNPMWSIAFPFEGNDVVLNFSMLSDVKYIAEENIYSAWRFVALYLEDGHFFIYSTGDGDDRWVHEYKITDGLLDFTRHRSPHGGFHGIVDFYLDLPYQSEDYLKFLEHVIKEHSPSDFASNWTRRLKRRSKS